jgi:hypothetical protein
VLTPPNSTPRAPSKRLNPLAPESSVRARFQQLPIFGIARQDFTAGLQEEEVSTTNRMWSQGFFLFTNYPEQIMTTYGPDGSVVDGPRHFYNITASPERKGNPFLRRKNTAGNFAPYSSTWNIEVEHAFSSMLKLRANYLSNNSEGLITVEPRVPSRPIISTRSTCIATSATRAMGLSLEMSIAGSRWISM